MIIVVSGSRYLTDPSFISSALSQLSAQDSADTHLFHGDAPGADTLAAVYAAEHDWTVHPMPADWRELGDDAGPVRNAEMLCRAKRMAASRRCLIEAVAFPGPKSRGTLNFKALCKLLKVPCFVQPVNQ